MLMPSESMREKLLYFDSSTRRKAGWCAEHRHEQSEVERHIERQSSLLVLYLMKEGVPTQHSHTEARQRAASL
jgi:hypothetical protein